MVKKSRPQGDRVSRIQNTVVRRPHINVFPAILLSSVFCILFTVFIDYSLKAI